MIESDGDDDDDAAGSAGAAGSGSGSAGASGRGGSNGGGSAGTSGSAGSAGAGGTVNSACGALQTPAEAEPNDENTAATAYVLGQTAQGCLATADDVDAFSFTVPDDGTGGGVLLEFTGVGAGSLETRVYVEGDNGALVSPYEANQGGNLSAYFAAAPGKKYYVQVGSFGGETFGYTMKATYTAVADAFEPNDDFTTATPVALNMPYSAYYFAGYTSAVAPDQARLYDVYTFDAAAGPVTVKLGNVSANLSAAVRVFGPDKQEVPGAGYAYSTTAGGDVTHTFTAAAGKHYVRVESFNNGFTLADKGNALAPNFTSPYQIAVTQP